jgi:hypothetical protein
MSELQNQNVNENFNSSDSIVNKPQAKIDEELESEIEIINRKNELQNQNRLLKLK